MTWRLDSRGLRLALMAAVLATSGLLAKGEDPKPYLLWPKGAPGALGEKPNDKPTLTAWLPAAEKAVGAAVVVLPGGGYGGLATDHEGKQIAQYLNSLGVAAFVCEYRHRGKGYGHPAPLQDAQRAIRTVRSKAAELKIDPSRIGIMGFSAGGHLASTAGTHFDTGKSDADDPIEKVSCRPDFLILCYPVIAFDEPYTHRGSQTNLLGKDASADLIKSLSNEKQVTAQTPPTFLFHTTEDTAVPPENSVQFYLALRKHKIPCELHIYEKGRHGVGLAQNDPVLSTWSGRLTDWLKIRGLLTASK
jgi:acetyl esterase/lipase